MRFNFIVLDKISCDFTTLTREIINIKQFHRINYKLDKNNSSQKEFGSLFLLSLTLSHNSLKKSGQFV